jgi:hypothetical protein
MANAWSEGGAMADLSELIASHKTAWAALEAAVDAADDAVGTDGETAADEAKNKASDATAEAIYAIIEHSYSSLDELKLGMAYIVEHHRTTGDGNLEAWLEDFADALTGGADV